MATVPSGNIAIEDGKNLDPVALQPSAQGSRPNSLFSKRLDSSQFSGTPSLRKETLIKTSKTPIKHVRGKILNSYLFFNHRWEMYWGSIDKLLEWRIGRWKSFVSCYLVPFHHFPPAPVPQEPLEVLHSATQIRKLKGFHRTAQSQFFHVTGIDQPPNSSRVFTLVTNSAHQRGFHLLGYLDDWLAFPDSLPLLLEHRRLFL